MFSPAELTTSEIFLDAIRKPSGYLIILVTNLYLLRFGGVGCQTRFERVTNIPLTVKVKTQDRFYVWLLPSRGVENFCEQQRFFSEVFAAKEFDGS